MVMFHSYVAVYQTVNPLLIHHSLSINIGIQRHSGVFDYFVHMDKGKFILRNLKNMDGFLVDF